MAERLAVTDLRKRYGTREVLRGVSFEVAPGEVLALLGPSGCGKTTTLNLVAGLDRPDAGTIALGNATVCGPGDWVPAHRRDLGMVFQGQMLWPHMTVREHLAFVLKARGAADNEHDSRIAEQLKAVRLTGRDESYPSQLSGGEAQRLSIARALVARPGLLLFDEPCANLDAPLRAEFLALLARLRAERRFSALYVTHDAAEAFELATRVAVFDEGVLAQTATPEMLCTQPASPAVARIVGGGALLLGTVAVGGAVETALGTLPSTAKAHAAPGEKVLCFLRTEDLRLNADGPLQALARASHYDGRGWLTILEAGETLLRARSDAPAPEGERVKLELLRPPPVFKA